MTQLAAQRQPGALGAQLVGVQLAVALEEPPTLARAVAPIVHVGTLADRLAHLTLGAVQGHHDLADAPAHLATIVGGLEAQVAHQRLGELPLALARLWQTSHQPLELEHVQLGGRVGHTHLVPGLGRTHSVEHVQDDLIQFCCAVLIHDV